MVMNKKGSSVLKRNLNEWRYKLEDPVFRKKMLETVLKRSRFVSISTKKRALPQEESWFENVWGEYLKGNVFK